MFIPERCALKDVGDARVDVRLVPVVGIHLLAQEGGEVLVHDDGLKEGE